ncbi:MAG: hypothetical protein ACLTL6_16695 [Holdemanella porci]
MNKSKLSVRQMCLLALFLAIEIIMYLTPIGYLRIQRIKCYISARACNYLG